MTRQLAHGNCAVFSVGAIPWIGKRMVNYETWTSFLDFDPFDNTPLAQQGGWGFYRVMVCLASVFSLQVCT
jgi:hypothetical protein